MIDQSSIIAIIGAGVTVVSMWRINSYTAESMEKKLDETRASMEKKMDENKKDFISLVAMEKRHALELASQRIGTVEKDVDEIFPRLRLAEDDGKKNCLMLKKLLAEHERRVCTKG